MRATRGGALFFCEGAGANVLRVSACLAFFKCVTVARFGVSFFYRFEHVIRGIDRRLYRAVLVCFCFCQGVVRLFGGVRLDEGRCLVDHVGLVGRFQRLAFTRLGDRVPQLGA